VGAIWAVEIPDDEPVTRPALPDATLTGGPQTYAVCRDEARRLRAGGAAGHRVDGGMRPGPARAGWTIVLYGRRPALVGWRASYEGRPAEDLLARVRYVQ
jgi:hypothetical protein